MTASFIHTAHSTQHLGADRAADVAEKISTFESRLRGVIVEISRSLKAGAPNQVATC